MRKSLFIISLIVISLIPVLTLARPAAIQDTTSVSEPESSTEPIVTQTVRGEVVDASSGSPLAGVTILLQDETDQSAQRLPRGTSTNVNGEFSLSNIPVGRQSFRVSYIGYETLILSDVLITSSREVVLSVSLRETVSELGAVVVTPQNRKDQTINSMSVAGGRLLSMEEASRFAGGYDDPARLVASFAGVAGNLADNAVVIRGNAPKGLLWQMEGVPIPTPSHFANVVSLGGGGITALSTHMIADSDFFTGAFPAEYGNALSGVFDLNMRNGNSQNHEHAFEAGVIGLDAASEGPLALSEGASYLLNYRYSTFALITPLLPEDAGEIFYQNLSFKVHLPTRESGSFNIWGLGANDRSGQVPEPDPDDRIYNQDREKAQTPTRFGAVGISHRILTGGESWLHTVAAVSGNGLDIELDRYRDDGSELYRREDVKNSSARFTLKSVFHSKFGPSHSNRTGIIVSRERFSQSVFQTEDPDMPLRNIIDSDGSSTALQGFSQSRIDIGRFSFTGGLHLFYHELTGDFSFEPRSEVALTTGPGTFSLSYGRHSMAEPLLVYFSDPVNRRLGLSSADHFVAGFNAMTGSDSRLKLELYYQNLKNIPVEPEGTFSVLNLELDWFLDNPLESSGRGRNYGLEMTFEKFLSNGWYAQATGSLFKSEYRGGDGVWRSSRFDRGYTVTLLGGREWEIQRGSTVKLIGVNGRINTMGGKRMSPVDVSATEAMREVVYDDTQAFSLQEPGVVYADVTVEYRTIRRRVTSVWSLQILNATGYEEYYGYRYNLRDGTIEEDREAILIPNLSYRIEF